MGSPILKNSPKPVARVQSPDAAWRVMMWFGAFIAMIGLGQLALYFFPAPGFGSPEWEYGASAQMLGALPLPTVGLAILIASALATASRRALIGLGIVLVLMGLAVLAVLTLFWTVAPMAVRTTPAAASGVIKQTIARTTLSGFGFGILYLWAAYAAFRQARRLKGV